MHNSNVPNIPPSEDATAVQVFNVVDQNWRFGIDGRGNIYAVAADVARSFDYRDATNALRQVEEDEKGTQMVSTMDSTGRNVRREMAVLYEGGIWELIFRSTKPEAKAIKKRVKEILHSLTSGSAVLVPQQRRELSNRELAQMVLDEADRADAAEARAAILAPAAESWNTLATADGDLSVADAAKILSRDPNINTGRNRLFTILGDLGWAYRQRGDHAWRAMQSAVNAGRLSEIPQSHYHPRTGQLELDAPQVRVTVKGLSDLHRILGGTVALTEAA